MFAITTFAVLIALGIALVRAFLGPTVFDRILAVNSVGTKTVLLIAALGFLTGRPDFLDIAIVYALINFIGVVAVLKFVKYGDLASSGSDGDSV
ncbi:MAG: pH regulation protein F [Rhodospirillaceae bacterium]|nr:pH regulation protein F [Rhodospirillaceae bacterium]MBT4489202.1 pH regulation protein F [Rhodospirillaceae bacterium]MBT5194263.1 pH regulation protein F [Rhodospirillaceae bacterium]MBT5895588.1 pH regulation protein F [Rhodospirillaceae bacterium]MBT6429136.1 pH regulation protein F [Rhodospirillaceae bacterium]